jgi:hypothetical protein
MTAFAIVNQPTAEKHIVESDVGKEHDSFTTRITELSSWYVKKVSSRGSAYAHFPYKLIKPA